MIGRRDFVICDVFAEERFQGNQLAVFPQAEGLMPEEMQALAREMHFSETTFLFGDQPTENGFRTRIFTPAREVPFAGHPTLGTAWVVWDRFLNREAQEVRLDLVVGSVGVEVLDDGERLVMTQPTPQFGHTVEPERAARVLGVATSDIDDRFPVMEVSTGLWFLVVPLKRLKTAQGIRLDITEHDRLIDGLQAKAVLAFCPETVREDNHLHVRVFCPYYDVPEDPATGSANGCLCAWLSRHEYLGKQAFTVTAEQGLEIGRPSRLHLEALREGGEIVVKVGGRVVRVGSGTIE